MSTFKENNFETILKERRSIHVYDETVKISHEEMDQMIAEATLAPSSVNMQPWRFVVVESPEGKDKLRPLIRFNTRQNDTSAAMILIFGDLNCIENAEKIYDQAVATGKMPQEVRDRQLAAIVPNYQGRSQKEMNDIVKIDSSLAAMQLMLVARAHGYDTNPIGGFEDDQLAEAFGLDPERYIPVLVLSIGKAGETGFNSVRLPVSDITTYK